MAELGASHPETRLIQLPSADAFESAILLLCNFGGHALLNVPIGALAVLTRRRSIWRALVLGISVVLAVGLAQKSLSWRHTNVHDILAGVTGVAIGIAAARARPSRRLRDSINQRRLVHPWLVLAASAWILVLVRHSWTNDFRVIVEAPDQRYIKMSMVSFYAFYSAHPWGALHETLLKFLLPVPLGVLLRMASPGGGPRKGRNRSEPLLT